MSKEESKELEVVKEEKSFKTIWKSKTFWINAIAMVAFLVQHKYGYVVDQAMQVQALSVVNILLRTISSEGVSWS
jgi:LPS O-antigen subunit length determinant protein (WzzB/FepE family)